MDYEGKANAGQERSMLAPFCIGWVKADVIRVYHVHPIFFW